MDIFDRHFHVASVSPNGVIFYESEYEDAEASVDDFLGLIDNVYAYQIGKTPLSYKVRLLDIAYASETSAVMMGFQESQFKIFWTSCDGGCQGVRPERN